jgi:poly(hydroxyalkanoate) depolymerase family esterase
MNAIDLTAMQKAMSLVRAGKLGDATALIQSSLAHLQSADLTLDKNSTRRDTAGVDVQELDFKPIPSHIAPIAPSSPDFLRASTFRNENTSPRNASSKVIEAQFSTKAGNMNYRLFVPERRDSNALVPLVLMLHGCTQNPNDFAAGTQMDRVAGEAGCFVVYPEQSSRANPGACWNWFEHTHQVRERGEPQALVGLVAYLISNYDIDASRVYVAGLSAGGAMAAILGEQYPEVFAAVGVHSGLPSGVARNLPEALQAMQGHAKPASISPLNLPMIVFHGDSDKTVSPVNGQCFAEAMTSNTGSSVELIEGVVGRGFTRKIYREIGGTLIGEYWEIEGAGHAWSGGNKSGSYTDPRGPDASAEMMRFFLESRGSNQPE